MAENDLNKTQSDNAPEAAKNTTENAAKTGSFVVDAAKTAPVQENKTEEKKADNKVEAPAKDGEAKKDGETQKTETKKEDVKYEFKAPEGVTLDKPTLEKFEALAREVGITPEQAQKLVDFEAARTIASKEAAEAELKAMNEANQKAIEQDKELGGANLEATKLSVGRAYNTIANALPKEARDAMDTMLNTFLGNDKNFVRFLLEIDRKFIREDAPSMDDTNTSAPQKKNLKGLSIYDALKAVRSSEENQ